MSALQLLVFLLVVVLFFYLTRYIPDATAQKFARIAIIVFAIIYFVAALGLIGSLESVRIE